MNDKVTNAFKTLQQKIQEFDAQEYPKQPVSGLEEAFCSYLSCTDVDTLELELSDITEGAYFGRQCNFTIYEDCMQQEAIRLEIAWNHQQIVVYTAKHHGFWVAPYTSSLEVLKVWKLFLKCYLYV